MIEAVLVVALVGLLAALVLPSLGGVRFRAAAEASKAQLRSHATTFLAYSNDYAGILPYVTRPDAMYTVVRDGDYATRLVYFQAVDRWNIPLAESYYQTNHLDDVFGFPRLPRTRHTDYNYSQVFLADPAYWNTRTRTGPEQWRSVRVDEVVFADRKALLVDAASERLRRTPDSIAPGSPVAFGFVDGSVRDVRLTDYLRGYPRRTGGDEWHGTWNSVLSLGMNTIDGARGRDVR